MARADSTVRVNIIGDAKSLQTAAGKAEGSIAGINKTALKLGTGLAVGFAADKVLDFGATAVKEADRVADATANLEGQLGDLSQPLIDAADDFSDLGQSKGDMLELEKRLVDIGKAAGISNEDLGPLAQDASKVAAAMSLIDTEGRDANYWIEQIGKAGSGSKKPLQELGVFLDEAAVQQQALEDTGKPAVEMLTEAELKAAAYKVVMEQLAPKIAGVSSADADLEQKQAALNAKWETLTGEIGGPLTDLLEETLDFVLRGVDGWGQLSEKVGGFDKVMRDALTPVARMIDLQRTLIDLLGQAIGLLGGFFDASARAFGGPIPGAGGFKGRINAGGESKVNINVQGGSPEAIEQAVRDAVYRASRHG
jgi:hypothetical protein